MLSNVLDKSLWGQSIWILVGLVQGMWPILFQRIPGIKLLLKFVFWIGQLCRNMMDMGWIVRVGGGGARGNGVSGGRDVKGKGRILLRHNLKPYWLWPTQLNRIQCSFDKRMHRVGCVEGRMEP